MKTGMLSSNQPLHASAVTIINMATAGNISTACNKCGDDAYKSARTDLEREALDLRRQLKAVLPHIPIVSLQQPMGWSYEPIGIVTAQTVTGTGMFSDVASSFTDLFGTQSGSYNAKLRDGENLCKNQLRGQTVERGGNAVLAVDVDYAEVGGQRAMLMVCMTGTAVKITALGLDDQEFFSITEGATDKADRVRAIEQALTAKQF